MTLPVFRADDDPGPSFLGILRRTGRGPAAPPVPARSAGPAATTGSAGPAGPVTAHGTTIVAVRYAEGVLLAGDRRATAGPLISRRTTEKIFPVGTHTGVAIAGALGPAMELVRLFQLQIEHYEKVEGTELTLDGQANQLSQMVREHLPAARQGFAVVPVLAGYDRRRGTGRLFQYEVNGARYEEQEVATVGSGSLHAGMVAKVGHRPDLDGEAATDLVVRALWEAADHDAATGGPDAVRGIYPRLATLTAEGFAPVDEATIAGRFAALTGRLSPPPDVTG